MKTRLLTLALLIVSSLSSIAQDKEELKLATQKMINLSSSGDNASLMDLMYPEIFNFITKENLVTALEKKNNGKDYNMGLVRIDPSIDYGLLTKTTNDGYFCIVNYDTKIKLEAKDKIPAKKLEAETKRFKDMLKVEDIYYDEASGVFEAKKRIQAVAIRDKTTDYTWKFIPLDDSSYLDKVLNEDIRTAIKEQ